MPALMIDPPAPFVPAFGLWNRHAQTVSSHFVQGTSESLGDDPVEIQLPDGDRLTARYRLGTSGIHVSLFHGLSGSSDANYMRSVCSRLAERGHGFLRVDHRGCGAGQDLVHKGFHAGRSADLAAALQSARLRAPAAKHVIVGFSLSGSIGLLLASDPELPQPDGILAVNPPVDLADCVTALGSGVNRLYERHFMQNLTKRLETLAREGVVQVPEGREWRRSLWAFDDLVTAPLAGFAGAEEYYRGCSTWNRLSEISTPTVIFSSKDDPLVRVETLRSAVSSASEQVFLHLENSGGHVGYVGRDGNWLSDAVIHIVEQLVPGGV